LPDIVTGEHKIIYVFYFYKFDVSEKMLRIGTFYMNVCAVPTNFFCLYNKVKNLSLSSKSTVFPFEI